MPTVKSNPAPEGTQVPEAKATQAGTPAATPVVVTKVWDLEYDAAGMPIAPKEDVTVNIGGLDLTASSADLGFATLVMGMTDTPLDTAHTFLLWAQYKAKLAIWQAENTGKAILEAHPAYAEYKAAVLAAETKLAEATKDIPEVQAMNGADEAMAKVRATVNNVRVHRSDRDFGLFVIPKRNVNKVKA